MLPTSPSADEETKVEMLGNFLKDHTLLAHANLDSHISKCDGTEGSKLEDKQQGPTV